MSRFTPAWSLLLALAASLVAGAHADEPQAIAYFEKEVLPILKSKCYACHSHEAGKSKGGLVVDSRDGLAVGGASGPAIVPGDPERSLLMQAVRREDTASAMPPDNSLTMAEIKILTTWVRDGAADPRRAAQSLAPFEEILHAAKTHWSLQPILRASPPRAVGNENPIDGFVDEKLRAKGLMAGPAAAPRDLARRLSFDLVGLPPTYDRVVQFQREYQADADAAVARFVDELLASPHYGERWGRRWLDLARYAEVSGGASNRARETRLLNAYTYRDYVIRALNDDKPYDRFIVEQLAADQIELSDPRDLAALGFLPIGSQEGTAQEVRGERLDTIGKVFLGLSIGCARCHDHKFDPISAEDFYALDGVLQSTQEIGVPRPKDPVGDLEACPVIAQSTDAALWAARDQAVAKARHAVAEYEEKLWGPTEIEWRALTPRVWQVLAMEPSEFGPLGEREYLRRQNVPAVLVAAWRRWLVDAERLARRSPHPIFDPWFKLSKLPSASFAQDATGLLEKYDAGGGLNRQVLKALRDGKPDSRQAAARIYAELFMAVDRQWQQDTSRTSLADADREALRQVLYAEGAPTVRAGDKWRNQFGNLADTQRNRLLAQVNDALFTHPGSPQRAMLLRDQHLRDANLLVRGEVDQPGDLVPRGFLAILSQTGRRHEFPANRSGRLELAHELVAASNPLTARVAVNRIWSWHFGTPIVASVDDFGLQTPEPEHRALLDWLAATFINEGWSLKKLHRRILLSRAYRRSALEHPDYERHAAADADNALCWRANVARLDFESLRDAVLAVCGTLDPTLYGPSQEIVNDPAAVRRTVYAFIDRPLQPLLSTFDVPDNSVTAGLRHESTSAGQALYLMNGQFVEQNAQRLLDSTEWRQNTSTTARITWLYHRLLQRDPSAQEAATAARFLAKKEADSAWLLLAQALLLGNEFVYLP